MCDYVSQGFLEKAYHDFPNIINLEVYRGACPCACVHCPVGRSPLKERPERFGENTISLDMLKKVIDEMAQWPHSTIRLHSVGEPILWPELVPALRYISQSSVCCWLFTSLVTTDHALMEALCRYSNIIEVSVNSIDAQDYQMTKGIDAFELVEKNIAYMSDYIRREDLKTRLVVSRVQSDSQEQDDAFVRYWKASGQCADAFVRKYHNYNNLLEEKNETSNKKNPCLVHWMRFNIAYDGTVVTCFNELFHKKLRDDVVLGTLQTNSIYEIWHSNAMKHLRATELAGYEGSDYALDFPCRNCFSCQAYDGKRETSDHQIKVLRTEK